MQLALARGGTGACNAVNTALTTDAQLQGVGESLSGALGLGEAELTGLCLPKSFTLCMPVGLGAGLATHLASVAARAAFLFCCLSLCTCPTKMLLARGNVRFPRARACFSFLQRMYSPLHRMSQSHTRWLPHLLPFKEALNRPDV